MERWFLGLSNSLDFQAWLYPKLLESKPDSHQALQSCQFESNNIIDRIKSILSKRHIGH